MSRYIDADKLVEQMLERYKALTDEYGDYDHYTTGYDDAIDEVESFPTADVVEVRHGTWYHGNDGGAVYAKCSACGRKMNYSCYGYAYCSLCGAKMDGKERGG